MVLVNTVTHRAPRNGKIAPYLDPVTLDPQYLAYEDNTIMRVPIWQFIHIMEPSMRAGNSLGMRPVHMRNVGNLAPMVDNYIGNPIHNMRSAVEPPSTMRSELLLTHSANGPRVSCTCGNRRNRT